MARICRRQGHDPQHRQGGRRDLPSRTASEMQIQGLPTYLAGFSMFSSLRPLSDIAVAQYDGSLGLCTLFDG